MFHVLSIALVSILGLGLLVSLIGQSGPATTPPPSLSTQAKPDIGRAVNDCGTLLGFGANTVMTKDRVALLALCLHPELKQLKTSK